MAFVISVNILRRQLDLSQLAGVALELETLYAIEAKKRQREHAGTAPGRNSLEVNLPQVNRAPQARDQAATMVGVSGAMMQRAVRHKKTPHD